MKKKSNCLNILKRLYFRTTGYSYTNMGRLFLRLFVGIMLMQFGIRQLYNFETTKEIFPSVMDMGSEATLVLMICIEIGCSVFIMFGFLTRLMTIPPVVAMIMAEYNLLKGYNVSYMIDWHQPGYVPIMFLGIFMFLILVGPGKISVDYFLSLYIIHTENKSEGELEEV